ncbi:hypothetical protein Pfo_031491 [Paulownia fortunei]|nr:hypothetical protein Pfo_031491 [Paulownia fortunei]
MSFNPVWVVDIKYRITIIYTIAQVVANARLQEADDEIVIAIENGDFIQGSPLTNFIAQKAQRFIPVYQEIYDSVGFDARVLGNHEFNFGVDYLKATESDKDGYELMRDVPGIDALITGHQHRRLAGKVNGVPFTQPGYRGSDVGCIHLDLQNQISDASLIQTATSVPQQEVMSAVDTAQQATEQYLDKPLGHLTQSAKFADPFAARRDNHPYIQLINRIASERLGVDIVANAIFNDAYMGLDTQVTRREVAINYPYAETLAILKITGSDFKLALEKYASYFSVLNDKIIISPNYQYPKPQHYNYDIWYGIVYAFDISQPIGSRLVDLHTMVIVLLMRMN